MRRLLLLLAVATLAVAAACGIDHGYVTSKRDVPAHDESYSRQVYAGETCTTSKVGKTTTRNCQPHYIYVQDTRRVQRACYVTLQNEKESGERSVDCASWDSLKINDQVTLK